MEFHVFSMMRRGFGASRGSIHRPQIVACRALQGMVTLGATATLETIVVEGAMDARATLSGTTS